MKKIITVLLVFSMLLLSVIPILAADSMSIVIDNMEVSPGEDVTINYTVKDNPGIHLLAVTPVYDSKNISVRFENGVVFQSMSPSSNGQNLTFTSGPNVEGNGVLFKMICSINKDAAPGKYEVGLIINAALNAKDDDVSIQVSSGEIVIKGDKTKPSDTTTEAPKPPVNTTETPKPPVNTTETPKPPVNTTEAPKPPVNTTEAPKPPVNTTEAPKPPVNTTEAPKPPVDSSKGTALPPKTTTPTKGGSIPKTGDAGVSLAVTGVIVAMSVVGVAVIMKKRKDY